MTTMAFPPVAIAGSAVLDYLAIQETQGTGSFLFFDNGYRNPNYDWGILNDSNDMALTFGTFIGNVLYGEPVAFSYGAPNASLLLSL